jgi:IgA Peptidase M64
LGQYAVDAQAFVDKLTTTAPFDTLRDAINVFRVDVTSTDSGADDPKLCGSTGATAATFFDASFCHGDPGKEIQRLLEVDNDRARAVAHFEVPKWHVVIVIVNSAVYGGSGGRVAVYSKHPDAVEIALHELGHTGFGLADEYSSFAGCGVTEVDKNHAPAGEPSQPNVTTNSNGSTIKWRNLIDPLTPVPTTVNPDCSHCDPVTGPPAGLPADVVGAFEGANTFHCGAYRPQFDCRMRTLGKPFCAVCSRRIRVTLTPFRPRLFATVGRLTFLLAQDVGGKFGPDDDRLDADVVVSIDAEPDRFFGFTLRTDGGEPTHKGMLDALRTAFNRNRQVLVEYQPTGPNNGVLLRVSDLP